MNTRRIIRSAVIAASVIALALATIALPAMAKGPKAKHGRGHSIEHIAKKAEKTRGKSAEAKTKAAAKKAAKGKSAQAKARKAARFVATGTVVAVGVETLTVSVKGGDKALRGTAVLVAVAADAVITRDETPATLADLVAGDHVALKGTRVEGVLTAAKVSASSPEPVVEEPTETTEESTEPVGDEPTEPVGDEPTEPVAP